jgi:hypothetical protein
VTDLEIAARNLMGRAIFTTGSLLMSLGGEMCGAAGRWDAVTDGRQMSKERRRA